MAFPLVCVIPLYSHNAKLEENMYSLFVSRVIDSIYKAIDRPRKNLSCFGEGRTQSKTSTLQDYSALSGSRAEYFLALLEENSDIFDININDYKSVASSVTDIKYPHSCYPKNIRRWIKGTLSRKKKCRVEFVAIAVCWSLGWGEDSEEFSDCRRDIVNVCGDILGENVADTELSRRALTELMWHTCDKCYFGK